MSISESEKASSVATGQATQVTETHVITMEDTEPFYDEPGEYGWIMEGRNHGFSASSVIITRTMPGGGPPLHSHYTEEVHVLPECTFAYVMGDDRFTVQGPCIVRIRPGVSHTFLNIGTEPVRLLAFLPSAGLIDNYEELGPNPLVQSPC